MRATIIGKARNLSIACENADKRVLGDIYVQGYEFIREAFGDENPGQFPSRVEGFISVFAQGSEALRRLLVVRNLEERYQQVIDRFTDLRNLTTFDKDGAKLFISVMLNAADFNYFIGFIEMNFFTELQYIVDIPFHDLPLDAEAQADIAARYAYVLPTRPEFQTGKPCFFPNAGISFGFEHPKLHENHTMATSSRAGHANMRRHAD